jgi:hypothetical protein
MSDLENMTDEERNRLASTMNSLLKDPALRKETLTLVKKKNPNAVLPELDQDAALTKLREEQQEEMKKLTEKVEKDAIERQWADLRRSWKERGLDPDLVQKTMTEKKIADPETAISFLQMESRMATPTPSQMSQAGRMKLPEEFKNLMKDPKSNLDVAHAAIDDLRSGKVKLG